MMSGWTLHRCLRAPQNFLPAWTVRSASAPTVCQKGKLEIEAFKNAKKRSLRMMTENINLLLQLHSLEAKITGVKVKKKKKSLINYDS